MVLVPINELLLNLQENNRYLLILDKFQTKENAFYYNAIEIIPSNITNYYFINLMNLKHKFVDCLKKPIIKENIGEFLTLKRINISEKINYFIEECLGIKENPKLIKTEKEEEEKLVYFIQSNIQGAIKIGVSSDPETRLDYLLPVAIPYVELKLLAVIEGGYKKEKELHKKFATYKILNEWFKPSKELLSYIKQIRGGSTN